MFKKLLQKLFPFLFSKNTYLAFGVEESPTRFPLEKARYLTMASYLHEESLNSENSDQPLKVLDIGCSEGMMLLYCQKQGSKVEFYGMDILPERLSKALERGYQSVLCQDIRQYPFPFPDQFFDAVICSHILEHLEEPGKVLQELNRIVKPGGLFLGGVPIAPLPFVLLRRHVTPIFSPRHKKKEALKRFGHVTFYSLPGFKNELRQYGFVTEDARGDFLIRARKFCLENYEWWFNLNQWYGKLFPGLLGHVTIKARLFVRDSVRIGKVFIMTDFCDALGLLALV